jgi:hypothetical protein
MPTARSSNHAPPLAPQTPACPDCGLRIRMRLVRIEPSRYRNLHLWCYVCDCGGERQQFVADAA